MKCKHCNWEPVKGKEHGYCSGKLNSGLFYRGTCPWWEESQPLITVRLILTWIVYIAVILTTGYYTSKGLEKFFKKYC